MNLRHRVRFETKVTERSSSGGMVDSWVPFADDVPAEIRAPSGRELIAAAQQQAQVDTWITIRWMPGIEPTMRVVNDHDGGRVYQILAVLPDDTQRHRIKLMCSTGTNEGQ